MQWDALRRHMERTICLKNLACCAAGAADDQHIFDLNVRLQYSDDAAVLLQALQVNTSVCSGKALPASSSFGTHYTWGCGPLQCRSAVYKARATTRTSTTPHLACARLQDLRCVTAADMPPEAMLQRPSLLQHVLALLQPADKDSPLPKAALHFLLCFVRRIKCALSIATNPDLLPASPGGLH